MLGNLSIPRYHGVEHLPADLAEPLCRAGDAAEGFHITIMVRCDAFRANKARGRGTPSPIEVRGHPETSRTPHPPHQVSGAPKSGFPPCVNTYVRTEIRICSETLAPEVYGVVNEIAANFLASGEPFLLPSYEETMQEIRKLVTKEKLAKRRRVAASDASAQRESAKADQAPASDAPLAVTAPSSAAGGALETAPALAPGVATSVATASGASFAPASADDLVAGSRVPGLPELQHLATLKLSEAWSGGLDEKEDRPACDGGPLPLGTAIGEGTYGMVYHCTNPRTGLPVAAKVFNYESRENEWKRYSALAEVRGETKCVRKALGLHMLSPSPGHPEPPPRSRWARAERAGFRPGFRGLAAFYVGGGFWGGGKGRRLRSGFGLALGLGLVWMGLHLYTPALASTPNPIPDRGNHPEIPGPVCPRTLPPAPSACQPLGGKRLLLQRHAAENALFSSPFFGDRWVLQATLSDCPQVAAYAATPRHECLQ